MAVVVALPPKAFLTRKKKELHKLGCQISTGGYGSVYLHECDSTLAVKVTSHVSLVMGECLAEVHNISHENIVKVERVLATRHVAMVEMKLVEGTELFDLAGKLCDQQMWRILKGVVRGTSYLHRRRFVHRDIKPENIIVAHGARRVVIIDLGSLVELGVRTITQGTRAYQAPEAQGSRTQIALPSLDDWSIGSTIATAAIGRTICTQLMCTKAINETKRHGQKQIQCILESVVPTLSPDPQDRLSARDLNSRLCS